MSRHGFRFIHATNLRLDEPLVGTGPLSGDDRELAEQATILAWEKVVETCLATQADFLLLTGNAFDNRSQSLRARVALERGLEKLDAHHIDVFVAPGNLDPHSAWTHSVHLPPNITLLGDEQQEPLAIVRDGHVLAQLLTVATPETDETQWSETGPSALLQESGTYRIGVLPAGTPVRWRDGQPEALKQPGVSASAATLSKHAIQNKVDFIACGEGIPMTERIAETVIHDPGPAQSLSACVTGSCGCSVVDVSESGQTRIDDVALATIRWERIDVSIERHSNWEDVIERMALAVMDRVADNDERLWIMNWLINGEGQVFESLHDPKSEQELWQLLESELGSESEVRRIHRLERFEKQLLEEESLQESTGLMIDFEELLSSDRQLVEEVRQELLALPWFNQPEARVVAASIRQASAKGIQQQAETVAGHWLY